MPSKSSLLSDFSTKSKAELFRLLNDNLKKVRNLLFLKEKNSKEFRKVRLYIARLNSYIVNNV